MFAIILEGVLFVACIAAMAALFAWLVLHYTPLGVKYRQVRNRRRLETAAELRCPIHGAHEEDEMVRLPSGARICPECYREVLHDYPA